MWKIRHWTMIGLSSGLRLGLTVEAKALKHRKIQKSFLSPTPFPNAHAHAEKYGWLARLVSHAVVVESATIVCY